MNKVVCVLEQFEALTSAKRQSRLRIVNAELALEEVYNSLCVFSFSPILLHILQHFMI